MFSIILSVFLGLLVVVNAFPALQHKQTRGVTPPTSDEFSLQMSVDGKYVSLTAVSNGTGDLVLQGGDVSVYPGTPGTLTPVHATFGVDILHS